MTEAFDNTLKHQDVVTQEVGTKKKLIFFNRNIHLVSQKLKLKLQTHFRPEFERSPKMTWLDFIISRFGGICRVCLGISFMSLVEIALIGSL